MTDVNRANSYREAEMEQSDQLLYRETYLTGVWSIPAASGGKSGGNNTKSLRTLSPAATQPDLVTA